MVTRVEWYGAKVDRRVDEGAVKGVTHAGDFLLEKANLSVPVATGALRDSGHVEIDKDQLTASVIYDADYAIPVHEDQTRKHPHGRAKWLQLTLHEQERAAEEILADELRNALEVGL